MDTTVGDVLPQTPCGLVGSACGCACTITLIILFLPCTITPLGQFKYGLVRNKVTGTVDLESPYVPGRYWIGFWKDFIEFPSTLNTIEFSDERPEEGVEHLSVLRSRDRDGKKIYLDISIQYRLHKEMIGIIYREMKLQYEEVFISELRDALAKAGNEFRISEVWENYDWVVGMLLERCKMKLKQRHAECWGLQLWRVRLEGPYEKALVKTQVRKQAYRTEEAKLLNGVVRAETQVALATDRKRITIIEAEGTAKVHRINEQAKAAAEAKRITGEARIVDLIREIVSLNETERGGGTGLTMTDDEILKYRKLMLMTAHKDAKFVYQPFGPNSGSLSSVEAVNSQRLMSGSLYGAVEGGSRRLDAVDNGNSVCTSDQVEHQGA